MSNPFASSVEDAYNPFASGAGFEGYNSPSPADPEPSPSPTAPDNSSHNAADSYQPYSPPDDGGYQPYSPPANDGGYQPYQPPGSSSSPPAGGKPSEVNSFKQSVGLDANPFKAAKGASGSTYKDPVTGMSVSEADLAHREAELARRENDIASKERAIQDGTYKKPNSRKNFPPIIHMWEYYPNEDLPANSIKVVQMMKWLYLATVLDLFVNCLCSFFTLAPGPASSVDSPATMLVLGLLFFIVFSPLSFEISFFVVYRALRDGKAVRFFCGLFTYIIWWAFLVFCVIGVKNTGACGFIIMIDIFAAEKNKWVGIFALIFCIMGTLTAVAMAFNFIQFVRYYKQEGLARKAIAEAGTMAAQYAKDHPDQAKEVATAAYNAGVV